MQKSNLLMSVLLIQFLLLQTCSRSPDLLSPQDILNRSVESMRALTSYEFLIDRSGKPVFLSPEERIAFRRAQGKFMAPDRISVNVRVIAPGIVTEVRIIGIGEEQWETNFLTGKWQPSDPRYSFHPARLFDAQSGIVDMLAHEMQNLQLLGLEELDEMPGRELYVVDATIDSERPSQLTYGMIGDEPLYVKIWIDPQQFLVQRILIVDPNQSAQVEDTLWQIDFWNFNTAFTIEKPALPNE